MSHDERALLRRKYLGFIFQGFNLLARTTALENVELPLLYRGVPKEERHKLSRQALDRLACCAGSTILLPNFLGDSNSA